jgi:hypothetical protein
MLGLLLRTASNTPPPSEAFEGIEAFSHFTSYRFVCQAKSSIENYYRKNPSVPSRASQRIRCGLVFLVLGSWCLVPLEFQSGLSGVTKSPTVVNERLTGLTARFRQKTSRKR